MGDEAARGHQGRTREQIDADIESMRAEWENGERRTGE
jgi:hypothetical protein